VGARDRTLVFLSRVFVEVNAFVIVEIHAFFIVFFVLFFLFLILVSKGSQMSDSLFVFLVNLVVAIRQLV
jgi:hypothetical protein